MIPVTHDELRAYCNDNIDLILSGKTTMVRNVTPQKSWLVKCRRWIAVKAHALTMISRFKFDFFFQSESIFTYRFGRKYDQWGALYQKIDGKRKQVYTSFEKALLSM